MLTFARKLKMIKFATFIPAIVYIRYLIQINYIIKQIYVLLTKNMICYVY